MSLTVDDLLALPVMEPARAEVVAGGDLDAQVRWIHTSEIYDISPLLQGGEVLLTTGLGLVGCSPAALAEYARALARKGVAALMMELGRTFTEVPAPLARAATDAGLTLVVLHGVVPFVEVTETVHTMLLAEEMAALRAREDATAALHRALVTGGTAEVARVAGSILGGDVGLVARDGTLVAGALPARPGLTVPVEGRTPATLVTGVPGPTDDDGARLVDLCAQVLAASLRQSPATARTATGLLRELAEGRPLSASDIAERAGAVGFDLGRQDRAVALVVQAATHAPRSSALAATVAGVRTVLGRVLVDEMDGDVLVAAPAPGAALRSFLDRLVESVDGELGATVGGRVRRVVAGPLVPDVAGLARAVPAAREAAALADSLALGSRVVLASDLAVYRLISSQTLPDSELERFVADQLGPLLEIDASTSSELVATLDAYLEAGLSKTAAAAALGIRRQTMYARLDRIARALGGLDLRDRQRRMALDLALTTWRLRSSAATRGRR